MKTKEEIKDFLSSKMTSGIYYIISIGGLFFFTSIIPTIEYEVFEVKSESIFCKVGG